jgi:Na+-driven multidrug efflux pump
VHTSPRAESARGVFHKLNLIIQTGVDELAYASYTTTMEKPLEQSRRLLIAKVLLWVATAAALLAAVAAVSGVSEAANEIKILLVWQLLGYVVFAGLFALLALQPHGQLPIWGLVVFNKAALAVIGVIFLTQGGVAGADQLVVWDGALVVILVLAFVFSRSRSGRV